MKTLRESFEENYMATEVPSRSRRGFRIKYVYTGLWYRWKAEPGVLRRYKCAVGAACAAGAALFLAAALRDSPLNYTGYACVTGTLSVAALLFEVLGVGQFLAAGKKVTGLTFRGIDAKLRTAPAAHCALLLCTAAFDAWEIFSRPSLAGDALIPLLYLLAGGCSLAVLTLYRRLPFVKEKGDDFITEDRKDAHGIQDMRIQNTGNAQEPGRNRTAAESLQKKGESV